MHFFRAFLSDRRGSTVLIAALIIFVVIAIGALVVDVSNFYVQKRRLQSAADLTAIAAASDLSNAQAAALATLAANHFPASALKTLNFGSYVADSSLAPSQRFSPVSSGGNAVQVYLQTTAPTYLGRIFRLISPGSAHAQTLNAPSGGSGQIASDGSVVIGAKATAVPSALATFAIGSRLLQLNGGVLNGVLGALLGGSLSLSVMDYQSLASANIDLFAFSNALATRANLTAVTYAQLAQSNVKTPVVLNALVDTARSMQLSSTVVAALTEIANAASQTTINLSPVLSFGPYGSDQVGSAAPISAYVSALDLVSAIAQVANTNHQVQLGLNANIPGIAASSLQLAIGERPVGTSFVAVGAQGASVHTAQTRLLLTVQLVASGQSSLVNVPIYIELASGTAQLASVQCNVADVTSSTATLNVTPSVVDGWIGDVSASDFTNFSYAPSPGPTTLLNVVNLAKVTGLAHATISNLSATPVSFSYSDIQQMTRKTTATTDYTASLLSNLIGGLQMNVTVFGLGIGIPALLTQTVAQTLSTALTPIDQLLASVLDSLGISLGQAVTWVSGVRCGSAVLVN